MNIYCQIILHQQAIQQIQQKKLNPDGTTLVIESSSKNVNGKIDKKTDSYKIDKNGNKIPLQKQIKN